MAFLPPLPRGSNQTAKISSQPLLNGTGFETNSWHCRGDRPCAPCNRPPRAGPQPSFACALPSAAVCDRCSGSPWQMVPKTGLLAGCTTCRPPIAHADVRANARLSARLCSKGTCLGFQVTPGAHSRGHAWSPGPSMPLSLRPFGIWPPDREWGTCLPPGTAFCHLRSAATCPPTGVRPGAWLFPGAPCKGFALGLDDGRAGRTAAGQGSRTPGAEAAPCFGATICSPDRSLVHMGRRGHETGAALLWTGSQMHRGPRLHEGARQVCAPVPGEQGLSAHSWERASRK